MSDHVVLGDGHEQAAKRADTETFVRLEEDMDQPLVPLFSDLGRTTADPGDPKLMAMISAASVNEQLSLWVAS